MRVAWSVDLSLPKERRVEDMQIIINEDELASAPEAVRKWVIDTLMNSRTTFEAPEGTGVPKNVSKAKKDKAIDATTKEATKPVEIDPFGDELVSTKPVTHDDVRAAGMNFVKTAPDGKAKLLAALVKVGAANIKECPADKLAELLAMLTVA